MAYRLINLGQFDGIFLPSRDEIESIAEQLGLTISFVEAGPGFNVTGFALSIESFISALRHPYVAYVPSQAGDTSEDI